MGLLLATVLIFPLSVDASISRVNGLGTTAGKPALTYLRVRNEIIAAVITGCGADPDAVQVRENAEAPGRCALILRADNGQVLRKLTPGSDVGSDIQMTYPLMGGVAVYPNSGTVPSDELTLGMLPASFGGLIFEVLSQTTGKSLWRGPPRRSRTSGIPLRAVHSKYTKSRVASRWPPRCRLWHR